MLHPHRKRFALACCGLLASASQFAAGQSATWLGAQSGSWSEGSRWSSSPSYPNTSTSVATISAAGAPYIVTVNSDITVGRIVIANGSATLQQTAGVIHGGSLSLQAGTISLINGTCTLT